MARSDHSPVGRFGPVRVLVISHDSRFVRVLRLLLDRRQFAVRVAGRHDRVAGLVARASDVVVVDAAHGQPGAARAVESIRRRWPDVEPVVVSDDDANAADALHKWGPPHQLLIAIERASHCSATRLRGHEAAAPVHPRVTNEPRPPAGEP
jgi:DNA-binding NtrC family response regulator